MTIFQYVMELGYETLDINHFASDLIDYVINDAGHAPTIYAFIKKKLKENYSREELLDYEFPSCSVFYCMDKEELNEILDKIYC